MTREIAIARAAAALSSESLRGPGVLSTGFPMRVGAFAPPGVVIKRALAFLVFLGAAACGGPGAVEGKVNGKKIAVADAIGARLVTEGRERWR